MKSIAERSFVNKTKVNKLEIEKYNSFEAKLNTVFTNYYEKIKIVALSSTTILSNDTH